MNEKKIFFIFLFCLSWACKQPKIQPTDIHLTIKVTDFRNKEIVLTKPASRIICLIESALSGFYMLQADSCIIAVPTDVYSGNVAIQYAFLDERIKNKQLPAPGNWDFVSIENIVALNPDLVVIWASQTEAIQAIEAHGIPVYAVFIDSFDDVYKEIKDFGILTGKVSRADSLIQYVEKEIIRLHYNIARFKEKRKSVYFMWAQSILATAGKKSIVNELIELSGCKNSSNIESEYAVINIEKLIEWNPDIIVMWYNPKLDPDHLYARGELKNITAIRNKYVYEFPSVFMCDLWTLKFVFAAKIMAKWCYPDLSIYLEQEQINILTELYGERAYNLVTP